MGRARLAAARDSIRLRARPQARRATSYRYENTEKETSRGTWAPRRARSAGFSRISCLENYPTAPKSFPQATSWGCSMQDVSVFRMRGRRRPQAQASRDTAHETRDDPQPHGPARAGEGCQPRRASHLAAPGQAAHRTADAHAASAGAGVRGARPEPTSRSAHAHTAAVACAHTTAKG